MSGNIFLQELTEVTIVIAVIENKTSRIVDFLPMALIAWAKVFFI